jgi:hypothetical protein
MFFSKIIFKFIIKNLSLDLNYLKRVNFQLYYAQANVLAVFVNALNGSMEALISMKVTILQ